MQGKRNTDDSPLFRYETFITFLTLVFQHEERETHNFYYADCSYIAHSQPPQLDWAGPAQSQISTNVFFKITKFSAHRFRAFTPQSYFLSGGFIMIFVIVISSAHERELYSMCVHLHYELNSSKPNQNE